MKDESDHHDSELSFFPDFISTHLFAAKSLKISIGIKTIEIFFYRFVSKTYEFMINELLIVWNEKGFSK